MSWLEQKVLAYEQMRFAQEQNRRVLPFEWGLEHIGGDSDRSATHAVGSSNFARDTVAHSDEWFATTPADDYALADNVLTFTSAIESPWPENNRVHAQFSGRAAAARPSSSSPNGIPAGKSSRTSAAG